MTHSENGYISSLKLNSGLGTAYLPPTMWVERRGLLGGANLTTKASYYVGKNVIANKVFSYIKGRNLNRLVKTD